MSNNRKERREALARRKAFPAGKFAALITAIFVTLCGVALQVESFTILTRAVYASIAMGIVVSLGVGVIRLADTDYREKTPPQ
ncbi:MAG: hypothetical protein AAF802_02820 [Planctomycetota bacterium]